jgi:hypothetical protein
MASNSLPLIPDLSAFPEPVRYLVLSVLVAGPLALAAVVVVGMLSSPTVVLEATVVDAPPSDAEVYPLSTFSEDSPIRTVVESALEDGSASVQTSVDRVRSADVPLRKWYVSHEGRVVRVAVTS